MRIFRIVALILSLAVLVAPELFVRSSYEKQHRDQIGVKPSVQFPLGTDALGRDRLARLAHAARTSLLLAAAAALVSSLIAGVVGCAAGWIGGCAERIIVGGIDLFLTLPWLFVLLTVRALLPLDVAPSASVAITFLLLGVLGWPAAARVVRARVKNCAGSDFALQARAAGTGPCRFLVRHLMPNMKPVLTAQFLVSIPIFVLTEANLGALGLGVTEPLPSLGSMLRELQDYTVVAGRPWTLAPALLLAAIVTILQYTISRREVAL